MTATLSAGTFDAGHASAPRTALPPRSCDCHVHVFDPARFPYAPQRTYTPGTATVADLLVFERTLGMEHVVLVQPSSYGTDNRCLLDGLRQLGPHRARGVAVVDPLRATPAQIDALHAAGVRSLRLNFEVQGESSPDKARAALRQALEMVADVRWSIQLHADLAVIASLAADIRQADTPIVLDHFAGLKAERGMAQPGFATVLSLLRDGAPLHVKLSAPYRASRHPQYTDLAPYIEALVAAAPHKLVWASDWPHTGSSASRSGDLSRVEPFRGIDSGQVLDLLRQWIPDDRAREHIMVRNPARLYGFDG